MNYLAQTEAAADLVQQDVFANYIEKIRQIDPEAIDDETGTIIGRNAATGELEPNATRTTGWVTPMPMVQGYAVPVPEDEDLQLDDPSEAVVTTTANPWPAVGPSGESPPLPAWVQPTGAHDAYIEGAWVTHDGYDYINITPANVWPPSPQSTFWRISPDPGPLPWVQPASAGDAYDIGDEVFHEVEGRVETYWRSNIAANTTEPGTDGTPAQWFDRWWAPIDQPQPEVTEWTQPVPGVASASPYEVDAVVTFQGSEYKNTVAMNVWPPAGDGAFGWVPNEPVRARDASGRFVGDNPATPDVNEAWE